MSNILERRPVPFDKRVQYGEGANQFAELRFPDGQGPFPLLFVIHGGFWKSAYDLSHISHLCGSLTDSGIVTCNLEYRRVGDLGGGWPGTFQDVSIAIDFIVETMSSSQRVDIARMAVLGHSAGGHLALWLSARHRIPTTSDLHAGGKHLPLSAVSLAGISNLVEAYRQRLGDGAVEKFIGGSPEKYPQRYQAGSPIELLPTGTRQVFVHGTADDIVPISQSENFVMKAERLGDRPILARLDGAGHFELIDPESEVWPMVVEVVLPAIGLD